MKKATRDALQVIGWEAVVSRYPATAINFVRSLNPLPNGPQAKDEIEQLEAVKKAIFALSVAIETLPDHLVREINHWAADENELEEGIPQLMEYAHQAALRVLPGLQVSETTLIGAIKKTAAGTTAPRTGKIRVKSGRSADEAAYYIAFALSEVYFLGRRKMHGSGKDPYEYEPNGPFQTALKDILLIEGFGKKSASTINNFSTAAKRELTCDRVKLLLRQNIETRKRWAGHGRVSLTTGRALIGGMSLSEIGPWQEVISDD